MGVLERAAAKRGDTPTFSRTDGGSRLDQILKAFDAHPKCEDFTDDDVAEIRRRLIAPNEEHGTKELFDDIRFVCEELGIDDRRLNYQNVQQYRAKVRGTW